MKARLIIDKKRIVSIIAAIMIAAAFIPVTGSADVYAAAKKGPVKPATPKVSSTYVDGTSITIKWSKAKRANNYQIAVRSANKKWNYLKSVKKTANNKKKYTKKNVYKVVKAGKKYKVYKYRYTYTILKTTGSNARSYVYNAPKGNTKYTLCVRAKNKKGTSSWTARSRQTQSHKHNWKKVYREEEKTITKPIYETKEVETVIGREAYCSECGMTIATSDDKDVDPEVTTDDEEDHELGYDHPCRIEYRDITKKETVTYKAGETTEVKKYNVLDHYECDCHTSTCCCSTKTLKGVIKTHSHTWGDEFVSAEPTCDANGSCSHTCSECGVTVKTRTIPKLGHSWGDEFVSVEPTCTKAGSYAHTCSRCGATEKTRTIAKLGHKKATREVTKTEYKTETVKWAYQVCNDCGFTSDDDEIFSAHRSYEAHNGGTGSCRWEFENKEVKTPYEVTYIETYCTRCGKILSSVKK